MPFEILIQQAHCKKTFLFEKAACNRGGQKSARRFAAKYQVHHTIFFERKLHRMWSPLLEEHRSTSQRDFVLKEIRPHNGAQGRPRISAMIDLPVDHGLPRRAPA